MSSKMFEQAASEMAGRRQQFEGEFQEAQRDIAHGARCTDHRFVLNPAWFGIRCLTGKEELADADLRALGLLTWAPTFRSLTKPRKRKKPVEVQRPLLPGYVFAQVPAHMWPRVRAARNVIGWVAGQDGPLPIRREVQLQKLRQRTEAGEFDHRGLGPNIRPGSMLEVLFGPMMGWRITFIGMVGKKIEGEIDLMGAPRRVLVNAQHVHLRG